MICERPNHMRTDLLLPLVLPILALTFTSAAQGQILRGAVADAGSGEPLAYVHIGVLNKNMGVISREDGAFELDLSGALPSDTLVFSMIGYYSRKFSIGGLAAGPLQVEMKVRGYSLTEVTVRDSPLFRPTGRTARLGRTKPTRTTTGSTGTGQYGLGGEWGIRIFTDGKIYRLKDIRFHHRWNSLDSILYRINIYELEGELPGTTLLSRELFVKCYNGDKWVGKEVEDEHIYLQQDVVVSVEIVQRWYSDKTNNSLFYSHGRGYAQSKTYHRASSQDQWQVWDNPPLTLYLDVEECEPRPGGR